MSFDCIVPGNGEIESATPKEPKRRRRIFKRPALAVIATGKFRVSSARLECARTVEYSAAGFGAPEIEPSNNAPNWNASKAGTGWLQR